MQDLVPTKEIKFANAGAYIHSANAKLHDSSVFIVRLQGYRLSHLRARCRHSKTLFPEMSYGCVWRSNCCVENTSSEHEIDS